MHSLTGRHGSPPDRPLHQIRWTRQEHLLLQPQPVAGLAFGFIEQSEDLGLGKSFSNEGKVRESILWEPGPHRSNASHVFLVHMTGTYMSGTPNRRMSLPVNAR